MTVAENKAALARLRRHTLRRLRAMAPAQRQQWIAEAPLRLTEIRRRLCAQATRRTRG